MSLKQRWVISCDMRTCNAELVTLTSKAGWGTMAVGKFGQKIHLCRDCREALQLEAEPEMFHRVITNGDYSADHTVLLDCGHEFTKVEHLEDGCIDCEACRLKWLESGEIAGIPALEDLLPNIPEE